MAEYDYVDVTTGADYYGEGVCSAFTNKHFIWKRSINLATAGDALVGTAGSGAFSAADILNIFNVVEGMCVNNVVVEVYTAEGATCTADIGDGTDPNGYLKLVDLNAAAWYQADGTYGGKYLSMDTPTHGVGKLYTTADTIDITFTHNSTDVAVFDVWIAGVYFNPIYVA